jgi:catechol 2,3-dioxygenase-like lactoylglutathione lyase family enzyme
MITGLAHVALTVKDLASAIAFYRDKLGLREVFDFRRDDGERFGVYLHVGGRSFIELFAGENAEPVEGKSFRHFCMEVDDINQTVAFLRDAGVEVSEPKLGNDHSWQAWVTDPDGNRIELHGYTPESKQLQDIGGD